MEAPDSYKRAYAQIIQHPYRDQYKRCGTLVPSMVAIDRFYKTIQNVSDVVRMHETQPFDLLVGDDVSGRIPARIIHGVLKRAHESAQAKSVPKLVFMPSGQIGGETWLHEWIRERRLRKQLTSRAHAILGALPVARVGIVTDIVTTGKSLARLEAAFSQQGATVDSLVMQRKLGTKFYLDRDTGGVDERVFAGVEKSGYTACSTRHPEFDAQQVGDMRRFIADYAVALYNAVYDDDVPLPNMVIGSEGR